MKKSAYHRSTYLSKNFANPSESSNNFPLDQIRHQHRRESSRIDLRDFSADSSRKRPCRRKCGRAALQIPPKLREMTDTFDPYISDIDHYSLSLPNKVTCCSTAFNKKFLACCRSDSITTLVDVKRKVKIDLKSHSGPVFASTFLRHSDYLLTGGRDRTVRLWNTSEFINSREGAVSLDFIYRGHTSHVTDIAASSLDLYFATASDDTTARLWRIESDQNLRVFVGHLDAVNTVAFHPNSNYVLTGSDDGSVRLWDVNTAKCQRVFGIDPKGEQGGLETAVLSVSMNPNGREVAASYRDGTIRVYDLKEARATLEYATTQVATQLSYNADGSLLASIYDEALRIWNSEKEVCKLQPKFNISEFENDENEAQNELKKSLVSVYFEGTGDLTLISS
ncbi:Oidioi.mRNA.OKI2018_I69.PAR.g10700.t1.cds [Oikopleura dioica]|uniref:Oidioi.mRNA.OKI2018_I69.PAR.g10700.t1.cds n=1 Tax=Oikopleura dioica TaxID=34765 RepID=A0ABN7RX58_OIKDI|nr:Oidioi.mRNA.OKI2018_I69.PAR.g10700.t1.cds [Oikopleura dioica]